MACTQWCFYLKLRKITKWADYAHFDDVTFFLGTQNFFFGPKKKVRSQKKSTLKFTIGSAYFSLSTLNKERERKSPKAALGFDILVDSSVFLRKSGRKKLKMIFCCKSDFWMIEIFKIYFFGEITKNLIKTLVDSALKCHLLEINAKPSFNITTLHTGPRSFQQKLMRIRFNAFFH